LTIPSSVNSIGDNAFRGNNNLISLVIDSYSSTNLSLQGVSGSGSTGSGCFYGCPIETVTWGRNLTISYENSDNRSAFGTAVNNVSFGNSVNTINNYAFNGCTSLTQFTISFSNAIGSIGDFAFYGCTGLTGIFCPPSLTSIGESAFQNCDNLSVVVLTFSPVTSIGNSAFSGCDLTELRIPNSVTSIGDNAFWGNSNLTRLQIDNGNTPLTIQGISNSGASWSGSFYDCPIETLSWVEI